MKNKLKAINDEYKQNLINSLNLERDKIVEFLKENQEKLLKLNQIERFIELYPFFSTLSMYTDDEVLRLIESFGMTKLTTKFFVPIEDFFKLLDEFQKTHKYYYLNKVIWFYYQLYSSYFFKKQIAIDFGIDLKKIIDKTKRQEKNGNLPEGFKPLRYKIKKTDEFLELEMKDFKFPFDGYSIINSIRKVLNFPHKIDFANLYKLLKEENKEIDSTNFIESDFKCEFYDLLEILVRDKSILNNSINAQLNYGEIGNSRFKIKRVERLILS